MDDQDDFTGGPEEQASASLGSYLAHQFATQPTMNEYLAYPPGTWESEAAYVAWKRSNPPGTKPPVRS